MWRVGKILTRARGFGESCWLERQIITVRPEDTEASVIRRWAQDNGVKASDVKLTILLQ